MSSIAYRYIRLAIKELSERIEVLMAERDELKSERDELRHIIESAGRVLAGKESDR